jgi:nucleotide-binding universal stress UspA family protein
MARSLIVHPTDLRSTSEGAFYHALKIALAGRSHLSLVHVHGYDVEQRPDLAEFPHVRETLVRWGQLEPGAAEKEVGDKLGLFVTKGELLALEPEAAVAKLLHDRGASMMVLGTRGLAGLQRLFEDSFSERLSREAKIPALFVPAGVDGFVDRDTGAVRLRNVLVPVAEDPDPTGALQAATGMPELLGEDCQFHLLHVGKPDAVPQYGLGAGKRSRFLTREGPVVPTIAEVAEEVEADLIVMATAGHKSFLDALRGSTTEGVLRTAKRALLAVPAE